MTQVPEPNPPPVHLLLIEDSTHDAELLEMMLKRSPEIAVTLTHVTKLSDAVHAFDENNFDIILLDLGLPDSTGVNAVQFLRTLVPETPIAVLTGDDRDTTAIEAINAGAQDYLPKQHIAGSLLTRMLRHSIARQQKLNKANSDALVDTLTGLGNRRSFDGELDRRMSDFTRHRFPFCIALFDIDHFKQINDRWGHSIGDEVIKGVADSIVSLGRASDHFSRYGGEEFAMIMPMTHMQVAKPATKRCVIQTKQASHGEKRLSVTVSCGLTEVAESDTAATIVNRADDALYEAKRKGRDRLMIYENGVFTEITDNEAS